MYALIIATGLLGWLLNIARHAASGACCTGIPRSREVAAMKRALPIALEIAVPLALLGAVGRLVGRQRHLLLPAADRHPETFSDTWVFERVGSDVVPSLLRLALGYVIACVVAVGVGLALGLSTPLRRRAPTPIVRVPARDPAAGAAAVRRSSCSASATR